VTIILIVLEVAVDGEAQPREEVITTFTASLLARVDLWKVELLVPAFVPFTFHW